MWRSTETTPGEPAARAEMLKKELAGVRAEADVAASALAEARMCENLLQELAGVDFRAVSKTQEQERRLHELLDTSAALFYRFDLRDRSFAYCNRAAREFCRFQGNLAEIDTIDLIVDAIHPEERAQVRRTIQAIMSRVLQGKYSEFIEYRRLNKKNEYRWLYEKVTFIPDRFGTAATLISSGVDITPEKETQAALRENERRYRTLTELCTDALWIIGLDYKTVFVNSSVEKMLGYPVDELTRMPLAEYMLPEYYEKVMAVLTKYLADEAASLEPSKPVRVDACYRRKDGTTFWGEVEFSGYRDERGRLLGICGATRDVTERRMIEEELKRTHRMLEERVRERTKKLRSINRQLKSEMKRRMQIEQFMLHFPEMERAAIGKELNDGLCQELAGIMFLCDAVCENLLGQDETAVEELSDIRGFLTDAIKQARAMAKGLSPLLADPRSLSSSILALAENTSALFNVRCSISGACDMEIHDPDQALSLYRIAQEAIHNAIRHGKARNIEVSLNRDAGNVRLTVSDDGGGRTDMTKNTSGMGLKIMAYRMRAMSGTLQILDRPEGGMSVECLAPKR